MLIKFLNGPSREITDLTYANLRSANLRSANLRGADLSGADLSGANLSGADLRGADLSGANLSGADLSGAVLTYANLRSANLRSADLHSADLTYANLHSADLRSAVLSGAVLTYANLRSADLSGADLSGADLSGARGLEAFVIAAEGILIGYKKLQDDSIVKLRIPSTAARVNAYGSRKCRAAYAIVISGTGVSKHDGITKYVPGKRVTADNFDPDPRVECSGGIHFFITEQEAKDY